GPGRSDADADRHEGDERTIDVARKEDRHGSQRAAVDDEEQRDTVEKADDRWVPALQVNVLAADVREARRQFGPDEASDQRDGAAQRPDEQNQQRIGDDARNVRRVREDADADDAARDDDDGVEEAEFAAESGSQWR